MEKYAGYDEFSVKSHGRPGTGNITVKMVQGEIQRTHRYKIRGETKQPHMPHT